MTLTFSAGGRHLAFAEAESGSGTRLVVDGHPEEWLREIFAPVFSADGLRYAYVGSKRGASHTIVIVNGKEAGAIGVDPKFTAAGRHLFTTIPAGAVTGLAMDGTLFLKAGGISHLYFAPVGSGFTVVLQGANPPDQFLVVDGEESDGFTGSIDPVFGGGGKRIGIMTVTPRGMMNVVIDGKARDVRAAQGLGFSPDGAHYAFLAGNGRSLYLDGIEQPVATMLAAAKWIEPGSPHQGATSHKPRRFRLRRLSFRTAPIPRGSPRGRVPPDGIGAGAIFRIPRSLLRGSSFRAA